MAEIVQVFVLSAGATSLLMLLGVALAERIQRDA